MERKRISIENSLHQMQEFVIDEYDDYIVLRVFLSRDLEHVDIPDEFEGKKVTAIGGCCFESCMKMKTLSIPMSIESIGADAFGFCEQLTELILPDSITEIDCHAFHDCKGLKKVVSPKKLKRLKVGVFSYCKMYNSEFILPEGLEVIERYAFLRGGGFELVIPDSVKEIEIGAFYRGPRIITNLPYDKGWDSSWPYGEEIICSGVKGKITDIHYLEWECMLHEVTLGSDTKQFVYPCDYLDGKISFVKEKNFQTLLHNFTYNWLGENNFERAYQVRKAWLRGLIAPH